MKEKPKLLETRINELKQIVKSASSFPPRRLKIIYSNTEYRLKEISGINNKYISELEEITLDCIDILDNVCAKDSFELYEAKLENLLNNILVDASVGEIAAIA